MIRYGFALLPHHKIKIIMIRYYALLRLILCSMVAPVAVAHAQESRKTLSLDGTWQLAEGTLDAVPKSFDHQVAVPGLVDMAQPAFEEVGVKSSKREAFWYRRTFRLDEAIPAVAVLKVHKAMFGTRVILNGVQLGEH